MGNGKSKIPERAVKGELHKELQAVRTGGLPREELQYRSQIDRLADAVELQSETYSKDQLQKLEALKQIHAEREMKVNYDRTLPFQRSSEAGGEVDEEKIKKFVGRLTEKEVEGLLVHSQKSKKISGEVEMALKKYYIPVLHDVGAVVSE